MADCVTPRSVAQTGHFWKSGAYWRLMDDDARVDSGQTGAIVIPRIHLRLKKPTDGERRQISEMRELLSHTEFWEYAPHREWLGDETILRFLIARDFNMDKALELITTALTWRALRQPFTLTATMDEMAKQGRTGKIYLAGYDRWKRPIVIFNNSVNNSTDADAQMRYLAFNLETALRRTRVNKEKADVCKFLIFMHMSDFSLFNSPPFKVTRETIKIVTTCYPETMGHCVIYQPPFIFSAFFESVKSFIDPRSASKIVMVTGDCSEGSANDRMLTELIAPNWKELTGAGQPRLEEGCSPGFDYKTYWPALLEAERRERAAEEDAEGPTCTSTVPNYGTPPRQQQQQQGGASSAHKASNRQPRGRTHESPDAYNRSNSVPDNRHPPLECSPVAMSLPGHASSMYTSVRADKGAQTEAELYQARRGNGYHSPLAPQQQSLPLCSTYHRAVIHSPLKGASRVLWVLLASAVTAVAWRASSPSNITPLPSLWELLEYLPIPPTAPPTYTDDKSPLPPSSEGLLLLLLTSLAVCILTAYPNNRLPLHKLVGSRRHPPTGGVVTLLPKKRAQTQCIVTTAAELVASSRRR